MLYTFKFDGLTQATMHRRHTVEIVIRAETRGEAFEEAGRRAAKLIAAEFEVDCVELVQVK